MKKNTYKGKFIVFEGLDGSGKATQSGLLYDAFRAQKRKAHLTREPSQYLIGGLIRSRISHDWDSSPECLQLLFCADRAHHLEKEIIPALKKGVTVICDRYFFSTVAYGGLHIKDTQWLLDLNKHFLLPDITFLLSVSSRELIQRMETSRFTLELFAQEEKLRKIWPNFLALQKQFDNVFVIDGNRRKEAVTKDILKIVTQKKI